MNNLDPGSEPPRAEHRDRTRVPSPDDTSPTRDAGAAPPPDGPDRGPALPADHERWTRAAAAFDAIGDDVGVFRSVFDRDGRLHDAEMDFANVVARQRWFDGLSLDEARGERVFARWPALRPLVFRLYAEVAESGHPRRETREFPNPGGPRVIDISVTPVPGGFVHLGRDVTDERRSRAALQESEDRLRRTISGVDAVVSFQDDPGGPLLLSEQARSILGLDPGALRDDEAWNALVHPDDLPACEAGWASPSGAWKLEYRMRRADGAWIWVSDRGRRNQPGDPARPVRIGVIVDITAQRTAADALRTSEGRLRRMVDGIDAIVAYQEAGVGPVSLSPQVERILGWRPDELATFEAWDAITHPGDLAQCRAAWRPTDAAWDLEYRVRRRDGAWAWVSDRGRRVGPDDESSLGMFGVITDVTARHESADRFRAIFEENPEAIALFRPVLDANGRFVDAEVLDANRAARELGLAPDPASRCRLSAWPDPDGRLREAAARVCELGVGFRGEVELRVGGMPTWSDLSFFPFAGGFALVGRDVTDQKLARLALRDSEARFRDLLSGIDLGALVLDPRGRVEFINDFLLRLLGRSRDELVGQDWIDVTVPEDERAAVREAFEAAIAAGTAPGQREDGIVTRSGNERRLLWTSVLQHDTDGGVAGLAAIAHDVTEARRIAAEHARLAAAIEQSAEAVVVADLDARITYVNPAFEAVTGYAREEVLGQNPRILNSGVQAPEVYDGMWAALTSGSAWRGELVNRRRDGSAFTESVSISPVRDAAGAPCAYVAVKRDVTGERALEAQLRQAQRLEAIGQLAGGIAHDFNNILAAINGYAELARSSADEGSATRSDLDQVLVAAQRGAELTRQLLAFSRRQSMASEAVEPAAVVEGLLPMLGRLLGPRIEIASAHGPGHGTVMADRGRLEQVVVNLAVNARDAMPDGGCLTIETSTEWPATPLRPPDAERPVVRIAVSDTGVGMDAATLDRVFEPFFTTKPVGKGTGMGLATIHGIVRQFGGTVRAESTPGRGSTFVVDLPAVAEPAGAAVAPGSGCPDDPGGSERILVVDDDEAVRSVTTRSLRTLGYDVVAAPSGEEALGLPLDGLALLVTDVRMPGIEGPDVARRMLAARPGMRVLFITGLADELSVALAGFGATAGVIEKPFSKSALARAVRDSLDGPAR